MSLLNILNISGSALEAQSKRISISASNLANFESLVHKKGKLLPYVGKHVILKPIQVGKHQIGEGVIVNKIVDFKNPFQIIYDPSNPISNKKGYVKTSNINPIYETISSMTASRNYQANIEVINSIKNMILKILTIGQ